MVALLFVAPVLAGTITVGDTGDHATIQAAVAAATDGDVILIQPGTYSECVDLGGLDLTLEGEEGAIYDLSAARSLRRSASPRRLPRFRTTDNHGGGSSLSVPSSGSRPPKPAA